MSASRLPFPPPSATFRGPELETPPDGEASFADLNARVSFRYIAERAFIESLGDLDYEGRADALERRAASTLDASDVAMLSRMMECVDEDLAKLPEPLQGQLRATRTSFEARKEAPAPLGPLLRSRNGFGDRDTYLLVSDVSLRYKQIETLKSFLAKHRSSYVEGAITLRKYLARAAEMADEEAASTAPGR